MERNTVQSSFWKLGLFTPQWPTRANTFRYPRRIRGCTKLGRIGKSAGRHSCDQVLDFDDDGLLNFQEEAYGTNPAAKDSDNDMLPDILEVNNANMILDFQLGSNCGEPVITPPSQRLPTAAPFADEVSARGSCRTWTGWLSQRTK